MKIRYHDFSNEDLFNDLKETFPTLENTYAFLPGAITYSKEYFSNEYEDASFIFFHNESPVLCCVCTSKNKELSFFDSPLVIHEAKGLLKDDLLQAYKGLKKVIKKQYSNINFISGHLTSQAFWSESSDVCTEQNSIIDLSLSNASIEGSLRKSYRSLINKGKNILKMVIVDSTNPDKALFHSFKDFHFLTAGRKTRSELSWDHQFNFIKDGHSYLVLAYLDENLVSGILVSHGDSAAYYSVGVNNRNLMADKTAIGHWPILYSAFHAKNIGLKTFELGTIVSPIFNEKELSIGLFKKGFSSYIETRVSYLTRF